ncbi:hypothetical protein MLD38_022336 [Melastoma candidum]|uniref:Uncharacterized protein n=1 Tax=Melastoma candidum TaxID=119954 RepID=A0ACB9QKR2_9MYRT|nr:hypothetical protein MLD38_022336 [Melastoma candidum]
MTITERDSISEIERRIELGQFRWRADREDVHMNNEAALIDMIGKPAKELHTARSRNDQVQTDFRLWCRDAINRIVPSVKHLQGIHISKGPNRCCYKQHYILSFVEQLDRDIIRIQHCRAKLNFFPLGACALAGTDLPIDRFMTSELLGFTAPLRNSIDSVSDRDFVMELLPANSIIAVRLSRLDEDWVWIHCTERLCFNRE